MKPSTYLKAIACLLWIVLVLALSLRAQTTEPNPCVTLGGNVTVQNVTIIPCVDISKGSHVTVQKHVITQNGGVLSVHVGECYRVKSDGALEKVDYCGNDNEATDTAIGNYCCGDSDFSSPPDPADVPASIMKIESGFMRPKPCSPPIKDEVVDGLVGCYGRDIVDIPACLDLNRVLIGPDGHKQYWCHLPQR